MTRLRDLVGEAVAGLLAKPARTLLVALGPLLGVAAIVGVAGVSDSTRGELRALLRELGTELVIVTAQPSVTDTDQPRLPREAPERVARVPTVASVAAVTKVDDASVRPSRHPSDGAAIAPTSVYAVDAALLEVVRARVAHGRFLGDVDARVGAQVAVLGARLASLYGVLPGEVRTILVGEHEYAVVGVLADVRLVPELDWAVLITRSSAAADWGEDDRPSALYVRTVEGEAESVAEVLPVAVTYGGPGLPAVSVPSSLLAADAGIDVTLRITAFATGGLALLVGAIGIANVLTISVLQRSTEIGVRRALGHTRTLVAGQFLLEAVAIGAMGAVAGAALAAATVIAIARRQGWTVVLDPGVVIVATLLAIAVSAVAGIYPAVRAARLDPLAALRA